MTIKNAVSSIGNSGDPSKVRVNIVTNALALNPNACNDWLTNRHYKSAINTQGIIHIQNHLLESDYTNEQVRSYWIEMEEICQIARDLFDINPKPGQKRFPVWPNVQNEIIYPSYHLLQDSHLITAIHNPYTPFKSPELNSKVEKLKNKIGLPNILGITALYEDYIMEFSDSLGSYSVFTQLLLMPDAISGKKSKLGAALGHQIVYGTKDERKKLYDEIQGFIDDTYKRNPKLSYNQICELASKKFEKGKSTIKKNTKDPKNSIKSGSLPA